MCRRYRKLRVKDHGLYFTPIELLLRLTSRLALLCLLIFYEEHTNEEIEEKEAAHYDKHYEENWLLHIILKFGPISLLRNVHGLVHDTWPSF